MLARSQKLINLARMCCGVRICTVVQTLYIYRCFVVGSSKYTQSQSLAHTFRPPRSREQQRTDKITRTSGESTRAASTEPLSSSSKDRGKVKEGFMTTRNTFTYMYYIYNEPNTFGN